MRKFQEAFNTIVEFRSQARGFRTKVIKRSIGDSVNNHRTITVGQAIRFARKIGLVKEAITLNVVSSILEDQIIGRRGSRTDAVDLNELVNTYRIVVMDGRSDIFRRKIGVALSKVG